MEYKIVRKISIFQTSNSFFWKILQMISDSYYAYRNRIWFDENSTFTVIHIAFARVPQIHRTKTEQNKATNVQSFVYFLCVLHWMWHTTTNRILPVPSVLARRISRTQCEQFIITTLFSAPRSRSLCFYKQQWKKETTNTDWLRQIHIDKAVRLFNLSYQVCRIEYCVKELYERNKVSK